MSRYTEHLDELKKDYEAAKMTTRVFKALYHLTGKRSMRIIDLYESALKEQQARNQEYAEALEDYLVFMRAKISAK